MIAGLESVTEGRVWLEGRDITGLPPEKRPLNTVFQSYALFPHMNVFQNIAYGLKVRGIKKPEQKQRVEEALRLVRLSGYEKRMPAQLSGGSGSASPLPGRRCCAPRCCFWTNRWARWI